MRASDAAHSYAQLGMMKSLEDNDVATWRGWCNISLALAELARMPEEADAVN